MGLKDTIERILEIKEVTEANIKTAFEEMDEIKKRIEAGESTGNLITDFSINYGGIQFKVVEEKFQELSNKSKRNIGKLFLVAKEETIDFKKYVGLDKADRHPAKTDGLMPPMNLTFTKNYERIGVLESEIEFKINEGAPGDIIFPCESHFNYENPHSKEWSKKNGPVEMTSYEYWSTLGIENPFSYFMVSSHVEKTIWTVALGNEVHSFYRKNILDSLPYVQILETLGQKIPEDFMEVAKILDKKSIVNGLNRNGLKEKLKKGKVHK